MIARAEQLQRNPEERNAQKTGTENPQKQSETASYQHRPEKSKKKMLTGLLGKHNRREF